MSVIKTKNERIVDHKYIDHVKLKIENNFDKLLISSEAPHDFLKNTCLLDSVLKNTIKQSVDLIGIKNNKPVYIICINKKEVSIEDLSQYIFFMLGGNFEGMLCYPDSLEPELKLIIENHNINWMLNKITSNDS